MEDPERSLKIKANVGKSFLLREVQRRQPSPYQEGGGWDLRHRDTSLLITQSVPGKDSELFVADCKSCAEAARRWRKGENEGRGTFRTDDVEYGVTARYLWDYYKRNTHGALRPTDCLRQPLAHNQTRAPLPCTQGSDRRA